jgi:hypothetical protein
MRWPKPDENAIRLMREAGVDIVVAPLVPGQEVKSLALPVLAEVPAESAQVAGARSAGYLGAVVTAAGDRKAFEQFVRAQQGFVRLVYLKPQQLAWDVSPAHAVLEAGMWPGIEAIDPSVAGATEKPWLNANLHVYAYLRGLYPARMPLLAFPEQEDPKRFDTVEIALAEAFAAGGNAVLRMPEAYRLALLNGERRAAEAWKSFAAVASFVKLNAGRRRWPDASTVAMLATDWEESEELLKMAFRNNVALRVLASDAISPRTGGGLRLIAAPNLTLPPETVKGLLNFSKSGGIVMASPATEKSPLSWAASAGRKIRAEPARDVFANGAGVVYTYRAPLYDPAEFALDLRDAAGQDRVTGTGLHWLDFRIWNSGTILGLLSRNAQGETMLVLIQYGNERDLEILAGVRGRFRSATLEHPNGNKPESLVLQRRHGGVELDLRRWKRLALVVLKEQR